MAQVLQNEVFAMCVRQHTLSCLICRALADFMRAFGGESIVQAAWGLAGLAPLPRCPALLGTEPNPNETLALFRLLIMKTEHAAGTSDGASDKPTDGRTVQNTDSIDMHTAHIPALNMVQQLRQETPAATSAQAASVSAFTPSDQDIQAAAILERLYPLRGSRARRPASGGDQLTAGGSLTDVPTDPRPAAESSTAVSASASELHAGNVIHSAAAGVSQPINAAALASTGQPQAVRPSSVDPAGLQRLVGSASEAIPEPRLVCMVNGMRLLVTLLRSDYTWAPVS